MQHVKHQDFRVNKIPSDLGVSGKHGFSRSCHKGRQKGWSGSAVKAYLSKSEWRERRPAGGSDLPTVVIQVQLSERTSFPTGSHCGPPFLLLPVSPKHTESLCDSRSPCLANPAANKSGCGLRFLIQFWLCCSRHRDCCHVSSFFFFFLDSAVFLPCSKARLECI